MTKAFIISKIKSKKPSFTTSLNAANRMGKAPIFLKHKAKNIGRAIKQNPKKSIAAGLAVVGAYGYSKTPMARADQNMKIEMQKISKERKNRVISSEEIDTRLKKARQSKREFTWI
jgi:hypothetical protein